jgi:hypothetical protein
MNQSTLPKQANSVLGTRKTVSQDHDFASKNQFGAAAGCNLHHPTLKMLWPHPNSSRIFIGQKSKTGGH